MNTTTQDDTSKTESEAGNPTAELENSNAFGVVARNINTGETKVLRTFFDFRHTAAEDYASKMRDNVKTLPIEITVNPGFHKCWSCGDHSNDERFLTKNGEGNRICRRCYHAPEIPRDVWTGERIEEGERAKRAEGGSR